MAEGGDSSDSSLTDENESLKTNLQNVFENASEHILTKAAELDSAKLLYFYARFKQAKEGPCNIPRPGFFDFQGKQKWTAWNDLGNMSREIAMKEYISEMKLVDPDWDPIAHKIPKNPLGVSVSVMACTEAKLSYADKTVFDFVKEGLLSDLKALQKSRDLDLNQKDSEGLALLHWACDRGHEAIVQWLLDLNADVNILDVNKQTPLHYASSCGHGNVVELLLKNGADVKLPDDEGLLAKDVSANDNIMQIFQ